ERRKIQGAGGAHRKRKRRRTCAAVIARGANVAVDPGKKVPVGLRGNTVARGESKRRKPGRQIGDLDRGITKDAERIGGVTTIRWLANHEAASQCHKNVERGAVVRDLD